MLENILRAQRLHTERLASDPEYAAELERRERESAADARAEASEALRLVRTRCLEPAVGAVSDEVYDLCLTGALVDRQATRKASEWWNDRRQSLLVLSGPVGSGKSVAVLSLLAQVDGGLWLRAADVVRTFGALFGDAQLIQQEAAKRCSFLAIEDVGTEDDKARMLSALLEIFDRRLSARLRPWAITTNLSKLEWIERFDSPRLNSRMRQHAVWCSVTEADMRVKP